MYATILGGGPAGLASAYMARKHNLSFSLYEAGRELGGNCRTFNYQGFLFDMGAHRFHDKDPAVTAEIKQLLGDQLRLVQAPSKIYFQGEYLDFPLSPFNLLMNLDPLTSAQVAGSFLMSTLQPAKEIITFEDFAVRQYGRLLSEMFLFNYSEKLWGLPPNRLSPSIGGTRLGGLRFATMMRELLQGNLKKTEHLDGSFYYPTHGYGLITQALAKASGLEHIHTDSRVTKIRHRHNRIESIELNNQTTVPLKTVINTLPLSLVLKLLDPAPPAAIMEQSARIRYRDVALIGILLNKESISHNATIYVPDKDVPFTRISEPRNRSPQMAPPGKTSLLVEVPFSTGQLPQAPQTLAQTVVTQLVAMDWFKETDIIDTFVQRIPYAYPIFEVHIEKTIDTIVTYLSRFTNLKLVGRNSRFKYTHLHNMLREAMDITAELTNV